MPNLWIGYISRSSHTDHRSGRELDRHLHPSLRMRMRLELWRLERFLRLMKLRLHKPSSIEHPNMPFKPSQIEPTIPIEETFFIKSAIFEIPPPPIPHEPPRAEYPPWIDFSTQLALLGLSLKSWLSSFIIISIQ